MTSYLLDTYAWVEYFEGSDEGAHVQTLLQADNNLYTAVVSIAELADVFHRNDIETRWDWPIIHTFIRIHSTVLPPTQRIAATAGAYKVRKRAAFPNYGLIDALILATARSHNAHVVTGDKHLTGEDDAVNLPEQV